MRGVQGFGHEAGSSSMSPCWGGISSVGPAREGLAEKYCTLY